MIFRIVTVMGCRWPNFFLPDDPSGMVAAAQLYVAELEG